MAEDKNKKEEVSMEEQGQEESERNKDVEAINRVIAGQNDIFEKHYKIDEMGLEFDIKIRYPNAMEQAKIHAQTSLYFDGLAKFMTQDIILAYTTLATIRTVGVKVPEFLQNDEDIYNMNVLLVIGRDYNQWLESFRY